LTAKFIVKQKQLFKGEEAIIIDEDVVVIDSPDDDPFKHLKSNLTDIKNVLWYVLD